MNGGDWAAIIAAGAWGVLVIFLCLVLIHVFRAMAGVAEMIRGVSKETVSLLGGLNETVAGVNVELARVDAIVAGVQNITATADSLVGVIHATVSNPMIKAVAFVAGAARGARKLKG